MRSFFLAGLALSVAAFVLAIVLSTGEPSSVSSAAGGAFVAASTPTPTSTPTSTPIPTPPIDITNYTFTNETVQTASDLHIRSSNWPFLPRLIENAPGCPPPAVRGLSGRWDFDWTVACVDRGESVVIEIISEPPATLACFNWTIFGVPVDGGCPWPGDLDCNGLVNAVDALKGLRHVAQLPVAQTEPCAVIGTGPRPYMIGDVNCSGEVDSIDALFILRYLAALPVGLPPLCPPIGP